MTKMQQEREGSRPLKTVTGENPLSFFGAQCDPKTSWATPPPRNPSPSKNFHADSKLRGLLREYEAVQTSLKTCNEYLANSEGKTQSTFDRGTDQVDAAEELEPAYEIISTWRDALFESLDSLEREMLFENLGRSPPGSFRW
eukprot:CAMPEP_0114555670 /NCGR_PEP_ID=MMETSP0114-20121206/8877_1 /TAXON_ID=31324 /ORGANISM="Goniomonas sp, Strain m" /LENGTH=141 /DNA_ID=CAMNT_0001740819 /DNA_START=30 /DNA_END=452 /DNA_ORIENTATION=+